MHGRVLPAILLKSLLGRCVHWSHPHAFLWHKILCVKDTDPNASLICHACRGALYDARRKRRSHDSLVGSAILVRFSSFGHLIKSLPPNSARTFQSHVKLLLLYGCARGHFCSRLALFLSSLYGNILRIAWQIRCQYCAAIRDYSYIDE